MKIINILALIPNRSDATSLYRGMGPLSDLRRKMEVNIIFSESVDDSILDMVDIVFMQRPAEARHLEIAQMCERNRTPLWVDYDDLLLEVPEDNPAYDHYSSEKAKAQVIGIIQKASLVTVSTPHLKRCLQNPVAPLNQHIYVVPNALPDKFLHLAKPFNKETNQVNWRGTNTHQRDLAMFSAEMIDLALARPEVTLTFVGWNPWFITQYVPCHQAIVVPPMPIGVYFEFMNKTNPPIQVVPLHNCNFNLSKSNIAWIESCLTGAVCIAPDWPEWRRPGVLTFKNNDDFRTCLHYALDNKEVMEKLHRQGMEYIRKNLLLSKVNEARAQLVHSLNQLSRTGHAEFPPGGEPETIQEEALVQ